MKSYKLLLDEIAEIACRCGRHPSEILLLVVSKMHSLQEILPLYEEGARLFGESRVQEVLPKIEEAPSDIEWHFIGPLQRKKVPKIIGKFALIHSVDSLELAEKISSSSEQAGVVTSILLEVNASGEESKHGLSPGHWHSVFDKVQNLPALRIEGLMTMAPLTDNKEIIRSCFRNLRILRDELQLHHLSMGMSHDYPIAIEEGATILRIGSILFGN